MGVKAGCEGSGRGVMVLSEISVIGLSKWFGFDAFQTIPKGWRDSFRKTMEREFIEVAYEYELEYFSIADAKEKYGELVIYYQGVQDDEAIAVLDRLALKYRALSRETCVVCGINIRSSAEYFQDLPICDRCNKERK